jgi:hypothetical protein
MERTKSILGAERLEQLQQTGGLGTARPRIAGMALNQLNRSSGPVSFGYSELENNNATASIISADIAAQTTPGIERAPFSIKNELKGFSTDGNANGNKKEMLDKGQNTNDDFNQVSDSFSAELSSTKEITNSRETANNKISTSPNALSSSSENNVIAENVCTSNKISAPSASSALSANSKRIIISMVLIQVNPFVVSKNLK